MNAHTITPLIQPTPSTCGQTCLAMLTGIDVDRIIETIGDRKTHPIDLRLYLRDDVLGGWRMERTGTREPCDGLALVNCQYVRDRRIVGHWMLWTGRAYIDPATSTRHLGLNDDIATMHYAVNRRAW